MKPSDFVSVIDGSVFDGELPKRVHAIHSVFDDKTKISTIKIESADLGDSNYDEVLLGHMLMLGYILAE